VNFSFDPQRGLIVLRAELAGPSGSGILQLALDTGAMPWRFRRIESRL
jgi:hypothetical protein